MRSGAGGPEQQQWGDAIKVDPADLRGRRRHARQHQRRGGGQARAEQGQRRQAARIPRLARGAGDLCQGELRVSGARRRRDRSDHRRARRAEDRSAAAHRDRRAPQGGERARRQGRLRPGRCDGGSHRARPPPDDDSRSRDERARPPRSRPARSDSWWLAASVAHRRRSSLLPLGGLVYFAARGSGDVWPHLVANVLPHAHAHDRAAAPRRRRDGGRRSASAPPGSSPCSAFPGAASSNGRCSCRSPSRPTSSPTPISTCCIRSGRCRRRCASFSASRGRAISGSRKSARSHGCIFLLGVVLYPYVYLPVRALFLMQSAATLEVARTLGAEPARAYSSALRCRWRARRSRSASASR